MGHSASPSGPRPRDWPAFTSTSRSTAGPPTSRPKRAGLYSHDAIYFRVIANAKNPASIRATVADRDNLGNEDRITIYLDTFNDHRRAYFFVVNPLGAQGDGMRTEGAASAGNMFGGNVDWNPDFRFESKGQLTDSGYVVELRIPFKSLRFPSGDPQTWGINVVRDVQATRLRGHVDRRATSDGEFPERRRLAHGHREHRTRDHDGGAAVRDRAAQWCANADRRLRSRGPESRRGREPQGRVSVGRRSTRR